MLMYYSILSSCLSTFKTPKNRNVTMKSHKIKLMHVNSAGVNGSLS